jgi:2-polyprenyl-3-methyl-5-hydroxy-6-metoxy-1,4-benzoquinol methylase
MSPRPSAEALTRLYVYESAANDAWVDVLLSDAEEDFQAQDFGTLLDEVQRHRPAGRLLDIGCSIGRLLDLARRRGYDVLGLELGERAAQHAREHYGLPILQRTLNETGLDADSFDVVTLMEVLEHLPQPREMLREVHRILKPGGALLIGVPNVWSLGVIVLHGQARTFNRNHLIFFSEQTLGRLLREEGFQIRTTMTAVTVLDSILNYFQMLDPFGPPETRYLPQRLRALAETADGRARLESAIGDFGLGYRLRMLAVAAKDAGSDVERNGWQ